MRTMQIILKRLNAYSAIYEHKLSPLCNLAAKTLSIMNFKNIALHVPTILLPAQGIDLSQWAVIACDQYTSQPEYWQQVKEYVEGSPSTLNLIFPEAFLESEAKGQIIQNIHTHMQTYGEQKILVPQKPGFILVDRLTPHAASRKGLIVALDLEQYDYREGSRSLIRPTEGTILDRLPPRIQVRENAPIELPHIMVLIDDPQRTVIEPLCDKNLNKIYDFDLMMQAGHITGYHVHDEHTILEIAENLAELADPARFNKKYTVGTQDVLLYAMGDGNHSFATARAIWEQLKQNALDKQAVMNHPARYALVELINVHDEGLSFEPIHRVVFNVAVDEVLLEIEKFYRKQGVGISYQTVDNRRTLINTGTTTQQANTHTIKVISQSTCGLLTITDPVCTMEAATLQTFLDTFLQQRPATKIDYIHGADVLAHLASQPGNIGFLLPAISKHSLFKTILLDGALPRKAFSLGEADEKRFYLECRSIS